MKMQSELFSFHGFWSLIFSTISIPTFNITILFYFIYRPNITIFCIGHYKKNRENENTFTGKEQQEIPVSCPSCYTYSHARKKEKRIPRKKKGNRAKPHNPPLLDSFHGYLRRAWSFHIFRLGFEGREVKEWMWYEGRRKLVNE